MWITSVHVHTATRPVHKVKEWTTGLCGYRGGESKGRSSDDALIYPVVIHQLSSVYLNCQQSHKSANWGVATYSLQQLRGWLGITSGRQLANCLELTVAKAVIFCALCKPECQCKERMLLQVSLECCSTTIYHALKILHVSLTDITHISKFLCLSFVYCTRRNVGEWN